MENQIKKEELLLFLANNGSCFNDAISMDFYLLATLSTDELDFMNDKTSFVTPLLKQICNYALVKMVIDKEKIQEMAAYIDEDNDMLEDSINIIENCFQYIQILQDENCHHPSILAMADLINGMDYYNNFNDITAELIEITDGQFQDNLIDFESIVDEKLLDIIDSLFTRIISKIKKEMITTTKDLLLHLSNYATNFLNTIMLMSENTTLYQKNTNDVWYMNDNYIHILKNDKRINQSYDLTLLTALDSFMIIMKKVDVFEKEHDMDSELSELIGDLKEAYILYQSYKYKYLKDYYKESKLLEKCKKM